MALPKRLSAMASYLVFGLAYPQSISFLQRPEKSHSHGPHDHHGHHGLHGHHRHSHSHVRGSTSALNATRVVPTGQSDRIGNLIDEWASHQIPGFVMQSITTNWFQGNAAIQCPGSLDMCFGKYLANHSAALVLGAEQLAESNRVMGVTLDDHMVYFPSVLKAIVDVVGPPLASLMVEYATAFDPSLLALMPPRHCVVHYRLGDLVTFTSHYGSKTAIIDPQSLADAVASFSPPPTTVEILSSGAFDHNTSYAEADRDTKRSIDLLQALHYSIKDKLPNAKVDLSFGGTPDEDWFRLARAPMAVIAAGSFAHYAAVAGLNNQVRSPAAKKLLAIQDGQESPTEIRAGWTTFSYGTRDW